MHILMVTNKIVPEPLRWRILDEDVPSMQRNPTEDIAKDLLRAMAKYDGVGLAANQVGLQTRMFVTNFLVAINPVVTNPQYYKDVEEGCLSIPLETALVGRAKKLTLKYFNVLEWRAEEREFIGHEAHVIQHEVDHLNGVLYTDYEGIVTGR